MWGCLARLAVSRHTTDTASSLLAHAWGLRRLGVGAAIVSLAGGRPKAALQVSAAAARPATSPPLTISWFSTSRSTSLAARRTGKQPRSSTPEELAAPLQAGCDLEQLITKQIKGSPHTLVDLEGVFNEWGGSFNLTHTVAALNKFARVSCSEIRDSKLQELLPRKWLQLLPQAGGHQCATALCACLGLSKERVDTLWAPTWAAFMQHVQQDVQRGSGEGLVPQDLADSAYAAAKLGKQPGPGELQLLTRKWLQLLPQADPHQCARALCACIGLHRELVDAVWAPTWAAFMQHVQRGSGEGLGPQDIVDAVLAAAQLRKQPGPGELQLLLQAFLLRLDVREGAGARLKAKLVQGIEQLSRLPGWQGGIRTQDMQLLRGVQQQRQQQQQRRQRQAKGTTVGQIKSARTAAQLQHICDELGGSFDLAETAAVLDKLAKVSSANRQSKGDDSSTQQVHAVWDPTWAAFMQHVQRDSGEGLSLQAVGQAVLAAARLCKQPSPGELQLLVQAFLQSGAASAGIPAVGYFSGAAAAGFRDFVSALNQLSQVPGWQGGVSEHDMQQLLGMQQQLSKQLTERMLTEKISSAETVAQLQRVCNESVDNFQVIHTAAALLKFSKLSRSCRLQRDSCRDSGVLQLLAHKWLQLLPAAGVRECSNVMFACASFISEELVEAVWAPTWAAFMQHAQQGSGEGLGAQDIAEAVVAATRLRKQPGPGELQLLVQAFMQPKVLESAEDWHIPRLVESIETISQLPGWQGGVGEQDWQQVLIQHLLK
jgi:hypothetical protein